MSARPLPIVLIALYFAVSALLAGVATLAALFGAAVLPEEKAGWFAVISFVTMALAVVSAAVTYGLWTRQVWASKLTLYAAWFGIAASIVGVLYDRATGNVVLQLASIAISIVIVVYIQKPEVAALFTAREAEAQGPKS